MEQKKTISILILDFLAIGDLLFTTPLLRTLRENYPEAKIYMSIQKKYLDVLRYNPNIDTIIPYDKEGYHSTLNGYYLFIKKLRKIKPGITITLQDNPRLALLAFFSGAPQRIGFARHWSRKMFYTKPVIPKDDQHRVNYYLDIVNMLPKIKFIKNNGLEMYYSTKESQWCKKLFLYNNIESTDDLIGLNVGASWDSKHWPVNKFIKLGNELLNCGFKVIITGGPEDCEKAKNVEKNLEGKVLNITGKTNLLQLAALIEKLDFLVSSDTGPLHIAVAMGTKTIALFGPTEVWRYSPYGKSHNVIKTNYKCQPCHRKKCLIQNKAKCMAEIEVSRVLNIIRNVGDLSK